MSDPCIILEATTAHLADILHLETHITGLSQSREREIVEGAIGTHDCLVSVGAHETIVGYVVLAPKAFFGRDFVRLLGVANDSRRLGVATALLAGALARCSTTSVFISTNKSNAAMRSLLAHDNWTFSGTLTGIDEGDPELVFWKSPTAHSN